MRSLIAVSGRQKNRSVKVVDRQSRTVPLSLPLRLRPSRMENQRIGKATL